MERYTTVIRPAAVNSKDRLFYIQDVLLLSLSNTFFWYEPNSLGLRKRDDLSMAVHHPVIHLTLVHWQ